jgi:dienelactone hydrolase
METPPEWCDEPIKQALANGASVETVVFPGATHAWDQPEQSGHTKSDWKGDIITNLYNEAVTTESRERAFSFLKGK